MYVCVCGGGSVCVCRELRLSFLVSFATCTACYSSVFWCGLDNWLIKFYIRLFVCTEN